MDNKTSGPMTSAERSKKYRENIKERRLDGGTENVASSSEEMTNAERCIRYRGNPMTSTERSRKFRKKRKLPRSGPMTSAERSKKYRENLKKRRLEGGTEIVASSSEGTTNAERCKRYRENLKKRKVEGGVENVASSSKAMTNAERCKKYKERKKQRLISALKSSTTSLQTENYNHSTAWLEKDFYQNPLLNENISSDERLMEYGKIIEKDGDFSSSLLEHIETHVDDEKINEEDEEIKRPFAIFIKTEPGDEEEEPEDDPLEVETSILPDEPCAATSVDEFYMPGSCQSPPVVPQLKSKSAREEEHELRDPLEEKTSILPDVQCPPTNVDKYITSESDNCSPLNRPLKTDSVIEEQYQECLKKHRKIFQCNQCNKEWSSRRSLVQHLRVHNKSNRKQFSCTKCNSSFLTKSSLTLHRRKHNRERPFECLVCHKTLTNKGNYKQHLFIHDINKLFQYNKCNHCNKAFFNNKDLEKHKECSHNNEKPFECNICKKCFDTHINLTRHMPKHAREKSYICTICKKHFSYKSGLADHMEEHEQLLNSSKYKPVECGTYVKPTVLEPVKILVDENFKCLTCKKCFSHKSGCFEHIRTHKGHLSFECVFCQKYFSTAGSLIEHINIHTLK